jgi:S-adenosylmethionine hydrolase
MTKTVALITDFGTKDWFVGEMKAVMLSITPNCNVVDISHEIDPGDIQSAAFVLLACYASFPEKTVFCVPVDPDTSENCPAIAVITERYTFIAPDNGVLSWILQREKVKSVMQLKNTSFFHHTRAATFRGRDIFSPVAAYLAGGLSPEKTGSPYVITNKLPFPEPLYSGNSITGTILYIDKFGNLITNIPSHYLSNKKSVQMHLHTQKIQLHVRSSYVASSQDLGLIYGGSTGFIEIGINRKNASEEFEVYKNDQMLLHFE